MAIDQQINELVRLYTVAVHASKGDHGSDAAAMALGMEKAALHAASAEAAMIQSFTMERMAAAHMKAAGIK